MNVRERVRHLSQLGGGPLVVRRAAARVLGELPEALATEFLATVIALAQQRWEPAVKVLPAFMRALEEDVDAIPHLESLQRVAVVHEQTEVEHVFAQGQTMREYDTDAAARADARLFSLPLGVLKSRARLTRNPDELERLAIVSNASVVREVLKNSRLTEALVVRIAARRPARPEPLVEIWRSTRWSLRPSIRRALAFNPYLPPEVGVKIVPLLAWADLEELAGDRSVHSSLRVQAETLLNARR